MLKKRPRFATALIYYFKYIYMQNLDLLVAIGNIMLTQKKELSILLMMKNRLITLCMSIAVILSLILSGTLASVRAVSSAAASLTMTPINHVVVIFGENVSFDHYFGTYPNATNPAGEPAFVARPGTPTVNGLTDELLTSNPNTANPQRLDRSQPVTCSQNHGYSAEQKAFDTGLMD